ncbi:MAG: S-layer homology domain-containing protein [Clostridiales bacterium]|nr:S-layer homology domain-containing protein [Clostridiales bacterium]
MGKWFVKLFLIALLLCTTLSLFAAKAYACGVNQRLTPAAGGLSHSIALKEDGTVWAWGSNSQNQLGQGSDLSFLATPQQVDGLNSIIALAAGYDFSLALGAEGNVYFLGEGGDAPFYTVAGLNSIAAIAAGQTGGLALDEKGSVWQWSIGQKPSKVPKLRNIAAIAAGGAHYLALSAAGEVWAWGANWGGQLGIDSTIDAAQPQQVEALVNIVSIAAGYSHSLAVDVGGTVYAWGENNHSQLGNSSTKPGLLPIKVKGISKVVQVSAGNEISLALTDNNEIYAWGYGGYGQLGDGTSVAIQKKPVKTQTEDKPIYICAGVYHNFYIAENGNLYTWGRNKNNQLGNGKVPDATKPVKVLSGLANNDVYFTDFLADASPWAVSELTQLYNLNLLPPMLWGNYQENVTRAEFAALLISIYETLKGNTVSLPTYPLYKVDFEDIKAHAFENEIKKAYYIKLVGGITSTSFSPSGKITRQEATKMICTFIALIEDLSVPSDLSKISHYSDFSTIADWAAPFVAFAYENDIMQGSGGKFNPLHNLTREQTLAIVYRTILKYDWR